MDSEAVSSTIGVAAIIGTVVVLGATVAVMVAGMTGGGLDVQFTAPQFDVAEDETGTSIRFVAGEPVKLDWSKLHVNIDGREQRVPMTFFTDSVADNKYWRVGDELCIVGPGPDCLTESGTFVDATLVVNNQLMWKSDEKLEPWVVEGSGMLRANCAGPVDVIVLGTAITYGAGGPDIPVGVDLNSGNGFQQLFGDAAVSGGEVHHIPLAKVGTQFAVRGHADHAPFHAAYESGQSDPHVLVLRNGDAVPDIPAFDNQDKVEVFLQPYVDANTGVISIEETQTIVLFEFNPNTSSPAADWQDLVVLFDFMGPLCTA